MESLVVSGLSAHAWRRGASSAGRVSLPAAFCSCKRRYGFRQGSVRLAALRRHLVVVRAEARADEPGEEEPKDSDAKEPETKEAPYKGVLRKVGKAFGVIAGAWVLIMAIGFRELQRKAIAEQVTAVPQTTSSASVSQDGQPNAPVSEGVVKEGEDFLEVTGEVARQIERFRDEMEKRNFGVALQIIDSLIEKNPRVIHFRMLRAGFFQTVGDNAMCQKDLEAVLDINPLNVQALQGIAMIRAKEGKSIDKLRETVEGALKDANDQNKVSEARELSLLLGQILTLQNKLLQALKIYEKLSQEDPSDYRPHLSQALVYTFLGDSEQADTHFKNFENSCPQELPQRPQLEKMVAFVKEQMALGRRNAAKY